jgi:hypothetical protein
MGKGVIDIPRYVQYLYGRKEFVVLPITTLTGKNAIRITAPISTLAGKELIN